MVKQQAIGLLSATWIRIGTYCVIAYIGGYLIMGETPALILGWMMVILGLINALNSYFYSVLVRRLEITTSGVIFNLAPLVFLFIDIVLLKKGLSLTEICGVLLLVVGGILFLGRKHLIEKFGKDKRLAVFGMFIFGVFYLGFQNYLFQYYSLHYHIPETNYLLSLGMWTFVFITAGLIFSSLRGTRVKSNLRVYMHYTAGSFAAKTANYGATYFLLKALLLASVSQVYAMEAFFPIMLMFLVLILQGSMHIKMQEDMSREALLHKITGVILISAGIFLVK
jgi:drug/metabolite transporter (DMT)-like permease